MPKKFLPYWLKGALIFFLLFLPSLFHSNKEGVFLFIPLYIVWWLLLYPVTQMIAGIIVGDQCIYLPPVRIINIEIDTPIIPPCTNPHPELTMYIVLATYIVVGAIVGWRYGRRKARRELRAKEQQLDKTQSHF